jgi:aspartate/glutamate racemase
MDHTLSFLHTSPVHIQTFRTLLDELAPDIPARHVVDESLLAEACEAGNVTPALRQRVEETVLAMADLGAMVVLCTCSTIGAVVEELNGQMPAVMLRIDRPMAEEAVERGSRIIVAATLPITLIPVRELIYSVAHKSRKKVQVIDLLCEEAWHHFERGDQVAYLQEIASQLQRAATLGDVIVLAQASMARASEFYDDLPVPVLTSPRSGLRAAIGAYRSVMC